MNQPDITSTRTLFLLMAEFNTGQIPVDRCCHYFGMSKAEANRKAARQALPVPAYRLGSQKSAWMVSAEKLASYIDTKRAEAESEWKKVHAA